MFIIVGTGAGGAILAKELAENNLPVTILEKGPYIKSKDAFEYYDKYNDSVDLLTTTCIGGATIVSMSNMVRALDEELLDFDVDLTEAYEYVDDLVGVHELDDSHIGKGTQAFLDAGRELGLKTVKMPKAIREEDCIQCGKCAFGCPADAKWSGKDFVDDAVEAGATLITEAEVTELIIEDNSIKGVKYVKDDNEEDLLGDYVVLSAGAISSALILRRAGIDAGREQLRGVGNAIGGQADAENAVGGLGLIAGRLFQIAFCILAELAGSVGSLLGEDGELQSCLRQEIAGAVYVLRFVSIG